MSLSRSIARLWACGLPIAALGISSCTRAPGEGRSAPPVAGPIMGPAGRIHVRDEGSGGLPVVFLHSYAGNADHWSNQIDHLKSTRRVIAIDLRGHGQSDPPASGHYDVDSLAADVSAAVDALHLQRFVLVGHSMGGSAAIAYAAAHPEHVAGLVLVGTPGRTPHEQAEQIMTSMRSNFDQVSKGYWDKLLESARPEVQEKIRSQIASVPRDASLEIIEELFDFDPLPPLMSYRGPKLLIDTPHGESPGALHNIAHGVRRKIIEGTSHWPQLDKPDEFNAILDQFLGMVPPPTT